MATIQFYIRSNKTGKAANIRCRLRDGRGVDLHANTGLKANPAHWSNKTQCVKNMVDAADKELINSKLRNLRNFILDELAKDSQAITQTWLADLIEHKDNPQGAKKKNDLFSFIARHIERAATRISPKTNSTLSKSTIRGLKETQNQLSLFSKTRKKPLDFKDIDLDFYHDFTDYLNKKKYSQNTIAKYIRVLKVFLNAAIDEGVTNSQKFKSKRFAAITEEVESIYLNESEIQMLYDLDLSEKKTLEAARDLFIVGCYTGLRVSDWHKVCKDNIENGLLALKQQKTGGRVLIPMHPTTEAILKKYDGKLPKLSSNYLNIHLKEIAKEAGIDERITKTITKGGIKRTTSHKKSELITTHTARRSFATNLYKAGFPSLSIMQVTGHKTETSFLKYIKVTPDDHARSLMNFWQNRPVMKVS